MYSFSYLEPVCCSMSSSNCCFLTCIQISQEADQVVWYSHVFQNFPQFIMIHTAKGFGMCPILCNPMRSLLGSSIHGDSPGKNTGVGCHRIQYWDLNFLLICVCDWLICISSVAVCPMSLFLSFKIQPTITLFHHYHITLLSFMIGLLQEPTAAVGFR